jgi:hypothetical protein
MKIRLLSFVLLLSLTLGFAQKKTTNKAVKPVLNDLSVSLHEETLNKVFDAMGEITGTNEYSVLLIKGKYHWTVSKSRINLKPDSSDFTCEAKVDVGPFQYTTPVNGRVKIWYDNEKNFINVKVTTAIFELYTKVLGKKIHIKDIELADYFTEPFQFEGPKTMGTDFEFTTPDSVVKKIYMQPCDCEMVVQSKQIISRCEVKVSNQPFPVTNEAENKNVVPTQADDPKKNK